MTTINVSGTSVTVHEAGAGAEPFLLLHGGAGPVSVLPFAELLADRRDARVYVPTHPGFDGTPRPDGLASVAGLAALYAALLDALGVQQATVIGNSIGGWVAAEMALLGGVRLRRAVLVNAVGAEVPGQPITDVSGLTPGQLAELSFHDPARSPVGRKPDLAALAAYTGMAMTDPGLLARLAKVEVPVDVVWGESDGIAPPGYGRAYAEAIPGARFTLLPGAGHLPQLEAPERLLADRKSVV